MKNLERQLNKIIKHKPEVTKEKSNEALSKPKNIMTNEIPCAQAIIKLHNQTNNNSKKADSQFAWEENKHLEKEPIENTQNQKENEFDIKPFKPVDECIFLLLKFKQVISFKYLIIFNYLAQDSLFKLVNKKAGKTIKNKNKENESDDDFNYFDDFTQDVDYCQKLESKPMPEGILLNY